MVSRKYRICVVTSVILICLVSLIVLHTHQVDISSEGEGTVAPIGDQGIRFYERLDLEIDPSEGYVSEVYVDGVLKERDVSGCTFSVSVLDFSDHSIHIRFVEDVQPSRYHALTVTSEGDGTVTPSGTTIYGTGEDIRIIATPSASNVIGDVIIDGVSSTPSNLIDMTMDSDHSVEVVFRPISPEDIPVSITVAVDVDIIVKTLGYDGGIDYGTVFPSGTVHVAPHGSITVMIELNPGFEVRGMSINGVSRGVDLVYTVIDITESVSMELSIVKEVGGHIIMASPGIGGSISPSGEVKVIDGGDQTFSFSPSSGYKVSHLMIDGKKVEYVAPSYTFHGVVSAHSIEVVFIEVGAGSTVTLTGVRIITPPAKTAYSVGESFDPAGMVVEAVYSDGSCVELDPSQFTITVDDPLTTSSGTVTVSYQGKSVVLEITVESVPVPVGIGINNYPRKVSYSLNETFDPTGMDIIVTYDDGSTSVKTTGFIVEDRIFTSYGSDSVTVTYTEGGVTLRCSVNVTVVDGDAFTVTVVSYTGTKVSNGSVVEITGSEAISTPLGSFSFDLRGIFPGIEQTIQMDLRNNWSSPVCASVFIDDISGSAMLADQILLTVCSDGHPVSKRLSEVVEGDIMTVGTVDPGTTKRVTVSLEYMNLPENNLVMEEKLDFSLGIDGSATVDR